MVERTHTLVFTKRHDTDRERKLDKGFSWVEGGANNRITELCTTGPYTHTRGCWGLAGIFPVILSGIAFARFGWLCSDCKSSIFRHNKIYIWLLHRFPILGFSGGFHTQNNSGVIVMWCDLFLSYIVEDIKEVGLSPIFLEPVISIIFWTETYGLTQIG